MLDISTSDGLVKKKQTNKILAGKRIILISFQVRKSDKRRSKICICSMFHILKLKVFSI